MPSLNFDESKDAEAIAIVKGGDNDKEVLYLHSDDVKPKKKIQKEVNYLDYSKELKNLKSTCRIYK
jgi:uncharacterized protein with ACT and thioredoxin-like domain